MELSQCRLEMTPRGGAEIDIDMRCNLAQEKYCLTHSSAILEYRNRESGMSHDWIGLDRIGLDWIGFDRIR